MEGKLASPRVGRVDLPHNRPKWAVLDILDNFEDEPILCCMVICGKGPMVIVPEMRCIESTVEADEFLLGSFAFFFVFRVAFAGLVFALAGLLFAGLVFAGLALAGLRTDSPRHVP